MGEGSEGEVAAPPAAPAGDPERLCFNGSNFGSGPPRRYCPAARDPGPALRATVPGTNES